MSNAREKISEIIADHHDYHGVDCEETADAIITALPEIVAGMVEPLVWDQLSGSSFRCQVQGSYNIRVETYGSGWHVLWSAPGITDTLVDGRFESHEQAKAAAQAHHTAQIMGALGLEPKP